MGYDISYDHLVGSKTDLRLLTERMTGSLFTRPEPRATFADLVRGLLADVPRKNSWQLAEHVGRESAYQLEWLLNGAKWERVGELLAAGVVGDEADRAVSSAECSPERFGLVDDERCLGVGSPEVWSRNPGRRDCPARPRAGAPSVARRVRVRETVQCREFAVERRASSSASFL